MMFWLFVCLEFTDLVTSKKTTQDLSSFFFFSFEERLCKKFEKLFRNLILGLSKVLRFFQGRRFLWEVLGF